MSKSIDRKKDLEETYTKEDNGMSALTVALNVINGYNQV
jgi:hypothetical protein